MLVQIMETEMFVYVLMLVVWSGKTGDGGQFVLTEKCPFTFLEIFQADTFNVQWMPIDLTPSIVGMTVKRRNDTVKTEGNRLGTKRALGQGRPEGTHDVITKTDVRSVFIIKTLDKYIQFSALYHITYDKYMFMST